MEFGSGGKLIAAGVLLLLIVSCSSTTTYAPVINGWQQPAVNYNSYVVKRGDTLYSIAWAYGRDYRELALANHLSSPYRLHAGQRLYLHKVKRARRHAPAKRISRWLWPAQGKIVGYFSPKHAGNKGLNIGGRYGSRVSASAAGLVVYCGSGLRSYGKLIIIKHNADFLSAYAHNRQMLVREGQQVKAGQMIATMGRTNSGKVMLHFEIRRNGIPLNPLRYLRKRKNGDG